MSETGQVSSGHLARYAVIVLAVVILAAGVILLVQHMNSHPSATQQWVNCLQRQLSNPAVTCP